MIIFEMIRNAIEELHSVIRRQEKVYRSYGDAYLRIVETPAGREE